MLYRTVKTDSWRDPWFHNLTPNAKLVFLYLFTNPSVSACGSMELTAGQIAFDTGLPTKKVEQEIIGFGPRVLWLSDSNVIVVRNFYKHQRSQSSANFTIAAKKAMIDLPEEARAWIGEAYPELKDTHTLPIPIPSPTHGDKEEEELIATVEVTEEIDIPPTPLQGDSPKPKRSIKTAVPEHLVIPVELLNEMSAEQGMTVPELHAETRKMIDHFKANGERKVDWSAAWRNWMRSPYRKPIPKGHAPPSDDDDRPSVWSPEWAAYERQHRIKHGLDKPEGTAA